MRRRQAIKTIIRCLTGSEVVVTSTGLISREMYDLKDCCANFYMTGSLGLASSLGLGLAISRQDKKVMVIEGDAALLMNLGTLATIGHAVPKNLIHIVLDNEAYGSCSEEPSVSSSANLEKVAAVTGYRLVVRVDNPTDLVKVIKTAFAKEELSFILVKIRLGGRRDLPRPMDLPKIKEKFKSFVTGETGTGDCPNDNEHCQKLIKDFSLLLKEISFSRLKRFSGIGLVLYDENVLSKSVYRDIRPSFECPEGMEITKEDCVKYLCQITQKDNPLHDGFVFINQNGILTHVAQYFVPPIILDVEPNFSHGIRYHSAQYGSYIEGVIATGVVSSDFTACYFLKGRAYMAYII